MKKIPQVLITLIFGCLLFWGARGRPEPTPAATDQKVAAVVREEVSEEPDVKSFSFVDVEGNQYEAEYVPGVPLHSFESGQMRDENGYKYYVDEAGARASRLGIDISRYQKSVDWQQIREFGIEFVIIRLGFRGYGEEGSLVLDEMYETHMIGALEAGLQVGVYFFSQAVSDEEAAAEAAFVLKYLEGHNITGPVVFDTEEIKHDTARTDGLSRTQFTSNCIVFCDRILAAGYEPMIYTNMKWLAFTLESDKLIGYQKWYADYEPFPQCPYEFSIWQYTESGTVPGIEGSVDLNIWFIEESPPH